MNKRRSKSRYDLAKQAPSRSTWDFDEQDDDTFMQMMEHRDHLRAKRKRAAVTNRFDDYEPDWQQHEGLDWDDDYYPGEDSDH